MSLLTTPSGNQIAYEVSGEGRPLVFLHGWGMSGRVWRHQEDRFRSQWQVIRPDLRGHGASSPLAMNRGMDELAADLTALVKLLDLRETVVVGWSLGAQIALGAYSRLAGRVRGLALVAGTPRFTASDDFPHALPAGAVRAMRRRLRRDPGQTIKEFFASMFAPGELSEDQCRELADQVLTAIPREETLREALAALEQTDLCDRLPSIGCPVLLVHGTADAICLPDASRYMAERLPKRLFQSSPRPLAGEGSGVRAEGLETTTKTRVAWLEGCGHAPFLSRPEEFNRLLEHWLDEIDAAH